MAFSRETRVAPAEPATRFRTVVFIDFWNFEGHLRPLIGANHPDLFWSEFSSALVGRVENELSAWSRPVRCDLEGTRVYAAPKGDRYTQKWFRENMGLAARYHLDLKKRQKTRARCLECGETGHRCSNCEAPLIFDQEKGVDAALVTDLLWLAWQDLYDLAIVVSSDSDLIAGIERVQLSGRKVVNARFSGIGTDVAQASWAATDLDWLLQPMGSQVWGIPGLWSSLLNAIEDAPMRLMRGENPRQLFKELRETEWFKEADADDDRRVKRVERLEIEAKKARYPKPE